MKTSPRAVSLLLLASTASAARSERIHRGATDPDHQELLGSFAERIRRGATGEDRQEMAGEYMDWIAHATKKRNEGTGKSPNLRSGLPRVVVTDSVLEEDEECRSICEHDVLGDDVCIGTATNPVPKGEVWMYDSDGWGFGCCGLFRGSCKVCCPPTEDDKSAFVNMDDGQLVHPLFNWTGTEFDNFVPWNAQDSIDDPDPWELLNGVCLVLSNFTLIQNGYVPMASIMQGIVDAGRHANGNGRNRNGISFTNEGVYHEMSLLAFPPLNGGAITYRVLGYDGSHGSKSKRVVELPWQMAPHGEAMFTELADPEEYGDDDKIVYSLKSPYLGDILVKMACCTEEELGTYEDVSVSFANGFLSNPDPPVRFTVSAQQCQERQPVLYDRHD